MQKFTAIAEIIQGCKFDRSYLIPDLPPKAIRLCNRDKHVMKEIGVTQMSKILRIYFWHRHILLNIYLLFLLFTK